MPSIVITRTPLRVSLIGGPTDLPAFYRAHGPGASLSLAIDKYVYVVVNRRFDPEIRVSYSKTEVVARLDDLEHDIIRECLKGTGVHDHIEVVTVADVPGRGTGLGSSSALTVGTLHALWELQGVYVPQEDLAEWACTVEMDYLGKTMGKQDAYGCALPGVKLLLFNPDGRVVHKPLPWTIWSRWQECLFLLYLGGEGEAHDILKGQTADIDVLKRMVVETIALWAVIDEVDMAWIGRCMHDAWLLKRQLRGATDTHIDTLYETAREAGAWGGKVVGAGGRGFLLLCAPPDKHTAIAAATGLRYLPLKVDRGGTRVVFTS